MSAGRRLAALVLATSVHFGTQAGDAERGESLHEQQCTRCHDAAMYTRPQSTIRDFAALRERVQNCELAAELMWFEEDVDDVAAWLNREFYHFNDIPLK